MNEDININQLAPEKPEKQTQANWQLCFDKKNPKPKFLWDGFLSGSVGALISAGGVGKSYLGIGLGISLTAKDMLGFDKTNDDNKLPGSILQKTTLHPTVCY